MPLPLLLIGAAVATGIAGIGAGISAKSDFDEAKGKNKKAKRIIGDGRKALKRERKRTKDAMTNLGRQKIQLHESGLKPFVDTFKKMKNVDYAGLSAQDDAIDLEVEFTRIEQTVVTMEEMVSRSAEALGFGALAGLATYGTVGFLGTASTGTAIAGLSGAAAKSATLAWLGGGSLAAGGFGVAGGTAVLGGIVAAPVLLVGGLWAASKADDALEEAKSNLAKAKTAEEAMKTAMVATKSITGMAEETQHVLQGLQTYLEGALILLVPLVAANDDYSTYDPREKRIVARAVTLAKTAHTVSEAPLLDDDGVVTKEIRKAIGDANAYIETINLM